MGILTGSFRFIEKIPKFHFVHHLSLLLSLPPLCLVIMSVCLRFVQKETSAYFHPACCSRNRKWKAFLNDCFNVSTCHTLFFYLWHTWQSRRRPSVFRNTILWVDLILNMISIPCGVACLLHVFFFFCNQIYYVIYHHCHRLSLFLPGLLLCFSQCWLSAKCLFCPGWDFCCLCVFCILLHSLWLPTEPVSVVQLLSHVCICLTLFFSVACDSVNQ